MNSVKKNLLIAGAVCSVVFGVLVAVSCLVDMTQWEEDWKVFVIPFDILWTILGIGAAAVGGILLKLKFRTNKKLLIAEISIVSVTILSAVIYLAMGGTLLVMYIVMLLAIAAIGLLTAGMLMPDTAGGQTQNPAAREAFDAGEKQRKLDYLKSLKDSGQLTEDEYKSLMMKELEK